MSDKFYLVAGKLKWVRSGVIGGESTIRRMTWKLRCGPSQWRWRDTDSQLACRPLYQTCSCLLLLINGGSSDWRHDTTYNKLFNSFLIKRKGHQLVKGTPNPHIKAWELWLTFKRKPMCTAVTQIRSMSSVMNKCEFNILRHCNLYCEWPEERGNFLFFKLTSLLQHQERSTGNPIHFTWDLYY